MFKIMQLKNLQDLDYNLYLTLIYHDLSTTVSDLLVIEDAVESTQRMLFSSMLY